MKRLRKLADKFFNSTDLNQIGNGLSVSIDELLEMRKYVAYLRAYKNRFKTSDQAGDVKSAFKGRGIEMEEIRAYNLGDDVRDIDWRVTARKDSPYTKLYAEEKDREIYVLLDLSAHMVFGTRNELKSVAAAKIAAMLGWVSMENKDRFGCLLFDGVHNYFFKAQNHQRSMMAILKKIAGVSAAVLAPQRKDSETLSKALQLLQQNIKGQATVFVVSDFNNLSDAAKTQIAALGRKSRIYMINVFDVLEEIAPASGQYMAQNDGQSLVFDSDSKRFREEYKHYFSEKRSKIRDFSRKFACRYMEVRTDLPLYKQIKL